MNKNTQAELDKMNATSAQPETRNPIYGEGLGLHSKHDDAKELKRLGIAYGDAPAASQQPQDDWSQGADFYAKHIEATKAFNVLHGEWLKVRTERDAERAAKLEWAKAVRDARVHADKLAADVEAERKAKMTWANAARDARAHADKLAEALRKYHEAMPSPESTAALAAYDKEATQ